MFYQLLDLAKENTAEARGALMLGLADILVHDIAKRSEEELKMFGEIALLLYRSAPKHDRVKLSRKVSQTPRTPANLAMALASDQVTIAMPVLEQYPSFSPQNLLKLADELSDDHLQIIARRKDLDETVSDTLVRRGSRSVHRILAGNREIRLSHTALRALVRHATQDVVLREDLALRSDLTPAICNMLIPHVSGLSQKRLRKLVQGALSKADLDKLARLREIRRKHGTEIDRLSGRDLWAFAEARKISFSELVVLLLQDDRLTHVAELLGTLSRVAPADARGALFKGNKERVIAMARETKLTVDAFSLLAKARCNQLRIPKSQAADWIKDYVVATAQSAAPAAVPSAPVKAVADPAKKRSGSGDFAVKRPARPKRETGRRVSAI
ncbi:DUF2336 domain-containing protein [Roseibium sp.]|uniref:DUF2336 domain-containing protein n=1 Tax=Roseibium sp. TaxID=1936156 RepID=UPI003A96B768